MEKLRTAEDGRFIESFKDYVDLLVDESCNELKGEESVPKEKFEEVGKNLVEASRSLKITPEVDVFVDMANGLAENRMIAPESRVVYSTRPYGHSVWSLRWPLKDMNRYFEKVGLTLWGGVADFEDRLVLNVCLGDAKNIDLPVGPKVTIFTKMIVENTSDTIGNKVLGGSVHSDATDGENIVHMLEPKLDNGRATRSNLKAYSSLTSLSESYKLDELAWTALSLECGDEKTFSEKYATIKIEGSYLHEIYHNQIAMLEGASTPTEEAAAQLYAISRKETNPFDCLKDLYDWKDIKLHKYTQAAETAFRQLKKAGYKKSLWKKLKSTDAEKVNAAGAEVRGLADAALTNLEAGMNWRNHTDVERELGLEGNYQKLHEELEKLGNVKYGR